MLFYFVWKHTGSNGLKGRKGYKDFAYLTAFTTVIENNDN